MKIYSYRGEYPEPLPERVFLDSGYSLTSLHEFSDDELVELGFSRPVEKPSFDEKTEKLYWDGESFSVIKIEDKSCNLSCFSESFQKSSLNSKLLNLVETDTSVVKPYIKFITYLSKTTNSSYSLSELKNHIDALLCCFDLLESDLNEMKEMLHCGNFEISDILESLDFYQNTTIDLDNFQKVTNPVLDAESSI